MNFLRPRLQFYLAFNFIPPFIFSTAFLVLFLETFQFFQLTSLLINKNVAVSAVSELFVHISVSFFPMAFPLATLFAVSYTLNKMSQDSEIVAMRSFGLSKTQMSFPLFFLALFISLILFVLSIEVIPFAFKQFRNTVIRLTSKGLLGDVKPGQFFIEIPRVMLFANEVENGGENMKEVFIHFRGKGEDDRIIVAKKGELIRKQSDSWAPEDVYLKLYDGNILKTEDQSLELEKIIFERYEFPIFHSNSIPGFINRANMMSMGELKKYIKKMKKKKSLKKKDRVNLHKAEAELWSRFNSPLLCLLFALLGIALGVKQGRSVTRNSTGIILLVIVFYYALFFTLLALSIKGVIPTLVAVFSPALALFLFGVYYYRKLDWVA